MKNGKLTDELSWLDNPTSAKDILELEAALINYVVAVDVVIASVKIDAITLRVILPFLKQQDECWRSILLVQMVTARQRLNTFLALLKTMAKNSVDLASKVSTRSAELEKMLLGYEDQEDYAEEQAGEESEKGDTVADTDTKKRFETLLSPQRSPISTIKVASTTNKRAPSTKDACISFC